MVSRRIAIILARGGSKRLPRKNILDLGGKPMLAWSIEAALESGLFDRVLVSTDSKEIAELGRKFGAEVPFLRVSASDDESPTSLATHAALQQAEYYWQTRFDIVAQLMANCPLRGYEEIRQGMHAFEKSGAPSQISCFRFGWMNPWWAVTLGENGSPTPLFPEALKKRSQDQPPVYCPTGALWIANRDAFIASQNFYMQGHRFQEIPWMAGMDVDDIEDYKMVQACWQLSKLKTKEIK